MKQSKNGSAKRLLFVVYYYGDIFCSKISEITEEQKQVRSCQIQIDEVMITATKEKPRAAKSDSPVAIYERTTYGSLCCTWYSVYVPLLYNMGTSSIYIRVRTGGRYC